MPLLTAIDEYDSTIRIIAAHTKVGLASTDPTSREAALRIIQAICHEADETVEAVLTGPLAVFQTSGWLGHCI